MSYDSNCGGAKVQVDTDPVHCHPNLRPTSAFIFKRPMRPLWAVVGDFGAASLAPDFNFLSYQNRGVFAF